MLTGLVDGGGVQGAKSGARDGHPVTATVRRAAEVHAGVYQQGHGKESRRETEFVFMAGTNLV